VAKHKASLRLIHSGKEKQINIFIHGYSAIKNQHEYDSLVYNILRNKPVGKIYLYAWVAGNYYLPLISSLDKKLKYLLMVLQNCILFNVQGINLRAQFQIGDFRYFESRAQVYGKEFKRHIAHIKGVFKYPINFIAHSLGTMIVFNALTHNDWEKYHINDVIFLGGTVDVNSDKWEQLLTNIEGYLYNGYSKKDKILLLVPDLKKRIGRNRIEYKSQQLVNRCYPSFKHEDYLLRLDYILPNLWKGYTKGA
jgi:hypothetical protein